MATDVREVYRLIVDKVGLNCVDEQGADYVAEPFVGRQDVRRFLARLGMIGRGRSDAELDDALDKVVLATKAPRPVVEKVLGIFCSGEGVPEKAICGKVPQCPACPIREHCRYSSRKPGIKQLPEDERPRERLIRGEVLTDAELLGILIGGGTMEETAVDLGRRLLAQCGAEAQADEDRTRGEDVDPLRELSTRSIREICRVRGIGPARASQLKAAFEVGKRLNRTKILGAQYSSSRAIFDAFYAEVRDLKKEVFKVVLLDSKNHFIKVVPISEGSLASSVVHPREVFNPVIRESASAVVFIHNHPSGDPTPSNEDIRVTARLKEAGELIGIRVLDHIVIGEGKYYSFLDAGTL